MIKAIVFDFDGMVYHVDELFSTRISKEFNIPFEDVAEFFKNEFSKCQSGELDMRDVLQKYIPRWGWKKDVNAMLDYWFEDGYLDPEMVELVSKLKKLGIICALCTNNEIYRLNYLKEKHKINEIFNPIIASCEVGFRKPDPKIFDELIKALSVDANEILFCDDKVEFEETAREMGFIPHTYKNIENFKEKLAELEIKI
jgi:putative hydrolase of the HAD superfamily